MKLVQPVMELVHSMCPTGREAGETGVYYTFLLYLLSPTPLVASIYVGGMMVGYVTRLAEDFIQVVPNARVHEDRGASVAATGISKQSVMRQDNTPDMKQDSSQDNDLRP